MKYTVEQYWRRPPSTPLAVHHGAERGAENLYFYATQQKKYIVFIVVLFYCIFLIPRVRNPLYTKDTKAYIAQTTLGQVYLLGRAFAIISLN